MKIQILQMLEGAKKAEGLTVIIDVFRAATVECCCIAQGAEKVYPISGVEEAKALAARFEAPVLIGERGGIRLPGFDLGNCPCDVLKTDMKGKKAVHTTSAGTQGLMAAKGASEILFASLVNAAATAEYIRSKDPDIVSIVPMGSAGIRPTEEDTCCAEYIAALLRGEAFDKVSPIVIMKKGDGARFFDPKNAEHMPPEDFYICTDFDRFDFALRLEKDEYGFYVRPVKNRTEANMLKEIAKKYYYDGNCNCAETVYSAACEYYGYERNISAFKTIAAFGGGCGCGLFCGALAGCVGFASLKTIETVAHECTDLKELLKTIVEKFTEKAGSTQCSEIRAKLPEGERCWVTVDKACDTLLEVFGEKK